MARHNKLLRIALACAASLVLTTPQFADSPTFTHRLGMRPMPETTDPIEVALREEGLQPWRCDPDIYVLITNDQGDAVQLPHPDRW